MADDRPAGGEMDPAMRMLLKMGYKPGSGLGKNEEGRVDPIEVKVRAKNVGLGFSSASPVDAAVRNGAKSDESDLSDSEMLTLKKKRVKKRVVEESDGDSEQGEPMKIIDMTGGHFQRPMIHDERSILLMSKLQQAAEAVNEGRREQQRVREAKSHVKLLEHQIEECLSKLKVLEGDLAVLESACSMVERSRMTLSIHPFLELLEKASQDQTVLYFVLSRYFDQAAPSVEDFTLLSTVASPSTVQKLLYHYWWQRVKFSLSGRPLEFIVDQLEPWMPLLPQSLKRQILTDHVYPFCDNLVGISPAFEHILKWCDPQDEVIAVIRRSIQRELQSLFADRQYRQAYNVFIHWQEKFPESTRTAMALHTICPLLRREMSMIIVNPQNQETARLEIILPFIQILPPPIANHLFQDSGLARRLMECVGQWIHTATPDYSQIADFLMTWRHLFPQVSFHSVFVHVNRCLDELFG